MPLPWLLLRWCNITNPHFSTLVLPAPKNSHRIHWKYTSVTIRPWAANGVCALGGMVRLCVRGSENQSIEHVWVSFPLMSHRPNNFVVFYCYGTLSCTLYKWQQILLCIRRRSVSWPAGNSGATTDCGMDGMGNCNLFTFKRIRWMWQMPNESHVNALSLFHFLHVALSVWCAICEPLPSLPSFSRNG